MLRLTWSLQRTSAKCQQVLTNNKQSGSNGWIFLLDRYCCCIGGSLALWNGDIQCVILGLLLLVFVLLLHVGSIQYNLWLRIVAVALPLALMNTVV